MSRRVAAAATHVALDAVPRIAGGVLGALPCEMALALGAIPVATEVGFHLVKVAVAVARARFPPVAVSGGVFIVCFARLVIGARGVALTPVFLFGSGIDGLSHALACQPTSHSADNSTDGGPNRSSRPAHRSANGSAGGAAA